VPAKSYVLLSAQYFSGLKRREKLVPEDARMRNQKN
jgi:hypothetical protein